VIGSGEQVTGPVDTVQCGEPAEAKGGRREEARLILDRCDHLEREAG
jgi:hypothetical protein